MKQEEIDALDAHVDEHLTTTESMSAQKLLDICAIWKGVRPIVKVARALLFWKPKWQAVLDQLITSLDATCPNE